MRRIIITTFFTLVFILALFGCATDDKKAIENIPIEYTQGSYAYDVSDFGNVVGDVDYVFAGYVEEVLDTVYKHPVKLRGKMVGEPYTNFSITVIDNIKGNLKKSTTIPMQKIGGLTQDGSTYRLMEDDIKLEVGKYYMFTAYGQPDGSLLISGYKSSTLVDAKSKSDVMESNEYSFYKTGFENEHISLEHRLERYKSKYEE